MNRRDLIKLIPAGVAMAAGVGGSSPVFTRCRYTFSIEAIVASRTGCELCQAYRFHANSLNEFGEQLQAFKDSPEGMIYDRFVHSGCIDHDTI